MMHNAPPPPLTKQQQLPEEPQQYQGQLAQTSRLFTQHTPPPLPVRAPAREPDATKCHSGVHAAQGHWSALEPNTCVGGGGLSKRGGCIRIPHKMLRVFATQKWEQMFENCRTLAPTPATQGRSSAAPTPDVSAMAAAIAVVSLLGLVCPAICTIQNRKSGQEKDERGGGGHGSPFPGPPSLPCRDPVSATQPLTGLGRGGLGGSGVPQHIRLNMTPAMR